jgi:hypothetical protein
MKAVSSTCTKLSQFKEKCYKNEHHLSDLSVVEDDMFTPNAANKTPGTNLRKRTVTANGAVKIITLEY